MFMLIGVFEDEGLSVLSKHVKMQAGRKLFSAEMTWKQKIHHISLEISVEISGWEYRGMGRISVSATGIQKFSMEYSGMFGEIAADVISEHYSPMKIRKRQRIEKIISNIGRIGSD